MRYDLTIDLFLDRLRDMPDIEAVQEIDLRLVRMSEERRALIPRRHDEDADAVLGVLNVDETRLRAERHLFVMRMDRKRWSKAVRALWGQEGLEQCLVWLETMGEPQIDQLPLTPNGRRCSR